MNKLDKDFRQYKGQDIDVYFNLKICQHSGVCTTKLPTVFNLKQKPWIKPDQDEVKAIMETIEACPSGALKYILKSR